MKNLLQKIGSILWIVSLVLLFMKEITFCYIALGIVLIIDLWLIREKKKTITEWYRSYLPPVVDKILTIAIVGVFIYFHSWIVGLYILQGTVNGHLNGDW